MASVTKTLNVGIKSEAGKGAARRARREGKIPGIVYGQSKEPVMITLRPGDMERELKKAAFMRTQFDLVLPDGSTEHVLPKAVQFHKVKDFPIHIDFFRIDRSAVIHVAVPVEFIGEESSPGLKRGGTLNVVRHEVTVICRADAIPSKLVADLTGLAINDSVKWSDLQVPEGINPEINDRDFAVATISGVGGGSADGPQEGEDEE